MPPFSEAIQRLGLNDEIELGRFRIALHPGRLMRLTDVAVRQLPVPGSGQRTYFDDTLPNFGCRVSRGGTRAFVVQHGADRRLVTIGRYPVVSLAEARAEAKRILAERALGRYRPQRISWDEALTEFIADSERKNKPRTVRDYKRLLNRHFPFGRVHVADITPQDINRRIDCLRKTTSEQNHALVAIKVFFRWAERRRYVEHSPCSTMQTIKRQSRDRVLTATELAAVYKIAANMDYPSGTIVQLCILTGLRRSEVAWLRREYFSQGSISLPASFTKNKREHVLPLGALAASVIGTVPINDDFLFPAQRGNGVFGGWSKLKRELDAALVRAGHTVAPWTLHDLRRTFASGMASLGVRLEVVEKLLNHISGSFAGVAGIYQRHTFMDEMRAAIIAWDKHLTSLLKS